MRYYCRSGSPVRMTFKLGIDTKTGAEELFVTGFENFQKMIDDAAESCDLNVIITRVRNGELDLLSKNKGMYGDFTNMPQTLQELMQTRIDAKYMYENLSSDVKKNMSFDDFMKDAGSKDWLKNLGFNVDEVKEEVTQDADKE